MQETTSSEPQQMFYDSSQSEDGFSATFTSPTIESVSIIYLRRGGMLVTLGLSRGFCLRDFASIGAWIAEHRDGVVDSCAVPGGTQVIDGKLFNNIVDREDIDSIEIIMSSATDFNLQSGFVCELIDWLAKSDFISEFVYERLKPDAAAFFKSSRSSALVQRGARNIGATILQAAL